MARPDAEAEALHGPLPHPRAAPHDVDHRHGRCGGGVAEAPLILLSSISGDGDLPPLLQHFRRPPSHSNRS
jgi:hypothetical protein